SNTCTRTNRPTDSGRAPLALDNREDFFEAGSPVRKQIDILNFALDTRRNPAIIEAHRHDKGVVQRHAARTIERVTHFGLEAAALLHRAGGETGDEAIR